MNIAVGSIHIISAVDVDVYVISVSPIRSNRSSPQGMHVQTLLWKKGFRNGLSSAPVIICWCERQNPDSRDGTRTGPYLQD